MVVSFVSSVNIILVVERQMFSSRVAHDTTPSLRVRSATASLLKFFFTPKHPPSSVPDTVNYRREYYFDFDKKRRRNHEKIGVRTSQSLQSGGIHMAVENQLLQSLFCCL